MDRGHTNFCGAVYNCIETITYIIWSQLWNETLSPTYISTVGYLNKLYRLLVIP